MSDRREDILKRLSEVLAAVDGVRSVYRNNIRLDENLLPSLSVLDGDEEIALMPDPMRWRDASAPTQMVMRPEIYIKIGANQLEAGTKLNLFRARIIKAVTSDTPLIALAQAARGGSGRIQYLGAESSFAFGRTMEGEMILRFAISYWVSPNELT